MSKQLTSHLLQLISSMTKAEKRHFTLYATRNSGDKQTKFLALFFELDKQQKYDEDKLLDRLPMVKKSQLSNLKNRLYEQLLISMRMLSHQQNEIYIRELMDFAEVLYSKGLYIQSLEQLAKAKQLSYKYHKNMMLLNIIEFEKKIESRHITHSHERRAEELIEQGSLIRGGLKTEGKWSDLALSIYGLYLKVGHVKNKEEYYEVVSFFESHLPVEKSNLSFFAEIYKNQSYLFYHYIKQEFAKCHRYGKQWVSCFENQPEFIDIEPELYMKGLHNKLSVLYFCNDYPRFISVLHKLDKFIIENEKKFDNNVKLFSFIYHSTAQINSYYLQAKFREGTKIIPAIERKISENQKAINTNRMMIFWYKFACLQFGAENYKECLFYLSKIINHPTLKIREDIQCFARVLNLLTHYELENDELIDYQVVSTYRFLLKMKDLQGFQKAVLQFLKNGIHSNQRVLIHEFSLLKNTLEKLSKDPFERRPFLYLDIISWLQCKIENRTLEEVIKERLSNSKMVNS